jgi:hypothetical protein
LRALAIVMTAATIGPPVGGAVVLLLTLATIDVRDGTVFAEILKFGPRFGEYIIQSYVIGLLPAFCFGILLCVSAFLFRWNSFRTAILISLLASMASPLMISEIAWNGLRIDLSRQLVMFVVVPAVVAAAVCWCLTRPLHRGS